MSNYASQEHLQLSTEYGHVQRKPVTISPHKATVLFRQAAKKLNGPEASMVRSAFDDNPGLRIEAPKRVGTDNLVIGYDTLIGQKDLYAHLEDIGVNVGRLINDCLGLDTSPPDHK